MPGGREGGTNPWRGGRVVEEKEVGERERGNGVGERKEERNGVKDLAEG